MPRKTARTAAAALTFLTAGLPCTAAEPETPKNIIVFVADGCGANTHRTYQYWHGEPMVYLGMDWSRHDVATYALRSSRRPSRDTGPLDQDPRLVYDDTLATDTTPDDGKSGDYPFHFRGYRWLRSTAPDSANTATAIFTGVPTYKGAINVDGAGDPVPAASKAAHDLGKAVGVVTSVPSSHATPACAASTHVVHRDMYHDISHQLLTNGVCNVIAGAGHPEYDDNATLRSEPKYSFISEEDWTALKAGTISQPDAPAWTLVDDVETIRSLAEGETPEQLFIMARAAQTLQEKRDPWRKGDSTPPGGHPLNTGVPTLTDLTLAALNVIDEDPDGFFLMVEGGAVDWGMHDNLIGRVIEEMDDFHTTIETVCELLNSGERGFDWSNTLVIVTADHDHLLLGPESDTISLQPVQDRGKGNLPGFIWHADGHSNQPVPLFARGVGAERFDDIPTTHTGTRTVFRQAEIGKMLFELLGSEAAEASEAHE